MSVYKVIIDVREKTLRDITGIDDTPVDEVLYNELQGWLGESGIHVVSVDKIVSDYEE